MEREGLVCDGLRELFFYEALLFGSLFTCAKRGIQQHSMFSYEPVRTLYLRISKVMKEWTYAYPSSRSSQFVCSTSPMKHKSFSSLRISMLHGCNSIFPSIESTCCIGGFHVGFSLHEESTELNGLFTNTELREMLVKKYYRSVDMMFGLLRGCID